MNFKKSLLIIIVLAIFNLFLLADNVVKIGYSADYGYDYGRECGPSDRHYLLPNTITYYDDYDCSTGSARGVGNEMFTYYGEDADCWSISNYEERESCLEKFPYGGTGSFKIGGSYISEGASYIKFASGDRVNFHWIMSTTTEPMGNVLGFKRGESRLVFGDNIIVDYGNLNLGSSDREIDIQGERASLYIDSGFTIQPLVSGLREIRQLDFNDNFKIFDRPVCGSLDSCADEEVGKNYIYDTSDISFGSVLKFSDTGYLCKDIHPDDNSPCYLYEYRLENNWDFFDKHDNIDEEFVKYECALGDDICSPQPYLQYKVINYTATTTTGRTSGVSGTVYLMDENCTSISGSLIASQPLPRDNISCKECGDSFNEFPLACTGGEQRELIEDGVVSQDYQRCVDGSIYWYNEDGTQGDLCQPDCIIGGGSCREYFCFTSDGFFGLTCGGHDGCSSTWNVWGDASLDGGWCDQGIRVNEEYSNFNVGGVISYECELTSQCADCAECE